MTTLVSRKKARKPQAAPLLEPVRRTFLDQGDHDYEQFLTREWLLTNGLGGYATGTVAGVATRRFHGLLIAALNAPHGRMLMLTHVSEQLRLADGTTVRLGGEERAAGELYFYGAEYLREFRLEMGMPYWVYEIAGITLEKRVLLLHEQNTVHINYRLVGGDQHVRLKLMPTMNFRSHDADVSTPLCRPYRITSMEGLYEVHAHEETPPLRIAIDGERPAFTLEEQDIPELLYRIEQRRGYPARGKLWSPGYFRVDLRTDSEATLIASTESWETIQALNSDDALRAEVDRRQRLLARAHPKLRTGIGAELVLAADQFIIRPAGRVQDDAWARASGDEVRSVIAGYHWFTDWGRDTMISLEGLTLTTGRHSEAGYILRTFARYVRDGLLPNMFPEREREGLYHTADATMWFFHAIHRYLEVTNDVTTLQLLMPTLQGIVDHHLRGTRFGIGVDPADSLLRQGAPGYQLTWMDAKVDDWVVTPRRGKPVEINALWYNALKLMERWLLSLGDEEEARHMADQAEATRQSFNERFWYAEGGYLYDVVDAEGGGNDPACRPNQIFAIAPDFPVLDEQYWKPVLHTVEERLLTPVGLRSLAPGHPDYKASYYGDLRARDAAYHQGTVWGWLAGPFIDAWLRVYPDDRDRARSFLAGFEDHLGEACIGQISEIFDAEAPFTARGCVAQAWSVAELLRCMIKTLD